MAIFRPRLSWQLITDDAGRYEVRTTLPVPAPVKSPTRGRRVRSWKEWAVIRGARRCSLQGASRAATELTTQAYFERGAYVEDDCCEGVHADNIMPELREDGVRVVEYNFSLVACR